MPRTRLEPKLIAVLREGIPARQLLADLAAGLVVGIVALPLALAFAIASGVQPAQGLYTAIVAGFLMSMLSGSRVQIGGPTGAFVVIVSGIVSRYGYDGLATATFLAGIMLVLMGVGRLGAVIKYIPFPVTVGFTTGIALIIAVGQVRDFAGLAITTVPDGSSRRSWPLRLVPTPPIPGHSRSARSRWGSWSSGLASHTGSPAR